MSIKKWVLSNEDISLSNILAQECGISDFVSEILMNRGYKTFEKASQFVENADEIASPLDMVDMKEAVNRIQKAIENCEKVAIYGDYDCDGITSTSMLYMYFQTIGLDVIYYIPERDGEGYGLNNSAIDFLSQQNVNLIVTVDNGISANKQVEYAKKLGIDMVITDHHQPSEEIPNACAVVDPHRKDCKSVFKNLCGAGVAFKLIATLEGDVNAVLESFGDIVAVGTIGDVVPLVSENRSLVKYGIKMLKLTDNLGLKALIKVAGLDVSKLTARDVAFMLVPRINAAGRMGSASKAVELLTCENEQTAEKLALELDMLNRKRKEEEQQILSDISSILIKKPDALNQRVLMFYNENWSHGIIGIICSKLVEIYGKPVIMMTKDDDIIKGSARSIGEFNMFNALNSTAEFLIQYGGHKGAGGFSLLPENLVNFKIHMQKYAKNKFDKMP
ncbi:MAG: single-stranded-DNA-specific exonuclease RecJ, partial [Oscillospiraceae bacterium]